MGGRWGRWGRACWGSVGERARWDRTTERGDDAVMGDGDRKRLCVGSGMEPARRDGARRECASGGWVLRYTAPCTGELEDSG